MDERGCCTDLVLSEEKYNSIAFDFHFGFRGNFSSETRSFEKEFGYVHRLLEDLRVYAIMKPNEDGKIFYIPTSIDISKIPLGFRNGSHYMRVFLKPLEKEYQGIGVIIATKEDEQVEIDLGYKEDRSVSIDRTIYLTKEEYQTALDAIVQVKKMFGLKSVSDAEYFMNRLGLK